MGGGGWGPTIANIMDSPQIIQGGMGVAVSNWRLAKAVSRLGQLGVVSGSILPVVLARRLQAGDADGSVRRALAAFPKPSAVADILRDYFVPAGVASREVTRPVPMPSHVPSRRWTDLAVVAGFVEVYLAREGHDRPVGLNLLEKVQVQTLPTLFGAMLAGVAYVLMGAGIPRAIPGVLDDFAAGRAAELRLDVSGCPADEAPRLRFDPLAYCEGEAPSLSRPHFVAIVSSATLATNLVRKSSGRVDGLVVEGRLAGGHNAPPRGGMQLDAGGEPIYGVRDEPELAKIAALGLPFWLAGGYGRSGGLAEARRLGAAGVQVGTPFAFCAESGMSDEIKRQVVSQARAGAIRVRTDPRASPTGMPFKVMDVPGSLSDPDVYDARRRVCDVGYLRQPYRTPTGEIGFRCGAEPAESFASRHGNVEETVGRKCLCNGLLAAVGLGATSSAGVEPALVTAGQGADLIQFLPAGAESYTAADVVNRILSPC